MDRRQRKTRQAIYQAFEELLAEHHYACITASQIIERAGIGRSTFYAHFETKEGLLEQMCAELFDHVFEGMELDAHTHETRDETTLEGMLAHLLSHLRDNHSSVCIKLISEGEPHFTTRFNQHLSDILAARLPERSNWVPQDLMRSMLVGCFLKTIAWWHDEKYVTPPEVLSHWYVRALGWETTGSHTSASRHQSTRSVQLGR